MSSISQRRALLLLLAVMLAPWLGGDAPARAAEPGTTTRRSVMIQGSQGVKGTTAFSPSISADGRYVAFASDAFNLVPGDGNGASDVFVKDRQTNQITRVSVDSNGIAGGGWLAGSFTPAISADGGHVAFLSTAGNLAGGDARGQSNIYLHTRATGRTVQINLATDGSTALEAVNERQAISISADGRYVAFTSHAATLVPGDSNSQRDVFVRDRQTGQTSRVSVASNGAQGDRASDKPAISADGRYVAFESAASNLVPDDTNGSSDIFVHDRQTGQTARVSVAGGGAQAGGDSAAPSISADGRYVAFESAASDLAAGDSNRSRDIFVHDRQTGQTTWVDVVIGRGVPTGGDSRDARISADGRFVTYTSFKTGLVANDTNEDPQRLHYTGEDVFVHDRQTWQTVRVSVSSSGAQADTSSRRPAISHDSRVVAFETWATNLAANDTNRDFDVYAHDRQSGRTEQVSVGPNGQQGTVAPHIFGAAVSDDGRYTVFSTDAGTFDPLGGTPIEGPSVADLYLHDRDTGQTTPLSASPGGPPLYGISPSISADGRYIAFQSPHGNGFGAGSAHIYDRELQQVTDISFDAPPPQGEIIFFSPVSIGIATLSASGRFVVLHALAWDLHPAAEVFVYDRQSAGVTPVDVPPSGNTPPEAYSTIAHAGRAISADGRFVVFASSAGNLVPGDSNGMVDVFVRDLQAGGFERVSISSSGMQANGAGSEPTISDDGRYVSFISAATNLVPGDTNGVDDVYVHDRVTKQTVRVSVASGGAQGNHPATESVISGDGRSVAFISAAALVPDDTNALPDVYVHDRETRQTVRVSVSNSGGQARGASRTPGISAGGRYVSFISEANNLVDGDANPGIDVFVRDRLLIGPAAGSPLTLQGWRGGAGEGAALLNVSLDTGVSIPVAPDGEVLISGVADGQYTIRACAPGYLCAEREIMIAGGAVTGGLPPLELKAGAVDAEGGIDIKDVTAAINAFGIRPSARTDAQGRYVDVNGDGVVNLQGLSLVLGNFGRVEPQAWP